MNEYELLKHYRNRVIFYRWFRNFVFFFGILQIIATIVYTVSITSISDTKNGVETFYDIVLILYGIVLVASLFFELMQNGKSVSKFRKAGLDSCIAEQAKFFSGLRVGGNIFAVIMYILIFLTPIGAIISLKLMMSSWLLSGILTLIMAFLPFVIQSKSFIRAAHDALIGYHRAYYDFYAKSKLGTENVHIQDAPEGKFGKSYFKDKGILPLGSEIDVWAALDGTYNDRTFSMGKVCMKSYGMDILGFMHSWESVNAKILFTGGFLEFGCKAKVNNTIVVHSRGYKKKLYPNGMASVANVKTGDSDFDREFVVKCHNAADAEKVFTDRVRAALLDYVHTIKRPIGMTIGYDKVFIVTGFLDSGISPTGLKTVNDEGEKSKLKFVMNSTVKLVEQFNS